MAPRQRAQVEREPVEHVRRDSPISSTNPWLPVAETVAVTGAQTRFETRNDHGP